MYFVFKDKNFSTVFWYLKYMPTDVNTTSKRNRMKDGLFETLLLKANANINI